MDPMAAVAKGKASAATPPPCSSALAAAGQAGSAGSPAKSAQPTKAPSTKTPPTGIAVQAAPKTVSESMTVNLEDLSTEADSGWRRLDPRRSDQLKTTFEAGEYGQNLLRKLSILHAHGQNLKCKDGKLKLADGKHAIDALKRLKAIFDAQVATGTGEMEFTSALVAVFTKGVPVQVLEFEDWDDDITCAWAAGLHDTESNKYRPTSLQEMVDVALRYQKKVPGGNWKTCQELLDKIYGKQRRMFVYRMVIAAKTLSAKVLSALSMSSIPSTYINENRFFMGGAADQHKRMSEAGQLSVIETASTDMLDAKPMSAAHFIAAYCAPMKHVESWLAAKRKEFGKCAELPAFLRVENFLRSARGRLLVLQCMTNSIRLEGTSNEQPGIEHCRALVTEMTALKLRPNPQSGDGTTAQGLVSALVAVDGSTPDADGSEAVAVVSLGTCGDEQIDLAEERALSRTDLALSKLNYYGDVAQLQQALISTMMPSSKVFLFVDVPTSKSKIALRLCEQMSVITKSLPTKKFKVAVSVGTRLELASVVYTKLELLYPPPMHCFTIRLVHGDKQHRKRKGAYLVVVVPADSPDDVPIFVASLATRARIGEMTRMRCMRQDCPLRPQEEMDALLSGGKNPHELTPECEMNVDDLDEAGVDVEMADADEDALEAGTVPKEEDIPVPPGARGFMVDLWPFAHGCEYYKHIIQALFGQTSPQELVYMATSAHPSAILAAHDMKMSAHVLLDRVKVHSQQHGQQILKSALQAEFYKIEKGKESFSEKRFLSTDLCFVRVLAPVEQPIMFDDVIVQKETWRSKVDVAPAGKDLELAVPHLVVSDLDNMPMTIKEEGGVKTLFSTRALKEGDLAIDAKCLLFSTVTCLTEFLNGDGNSALLEGPLVKVDNLAVSGGDDSGSETRELYAVFVGAAMFIRDYRGKRGRPNVTMRVTPSKGSADGFISFVVTTRNGCGIAAGSIILADFGEHFTQTAAPLSTSVKRFRGALDVIIAKQLAENVAVVDGAESSAAAVAAAAVVAASAFAAAAAAAAKANAALPAVLAPAAPKPPGAAAAAVGEIPVGAHADYILVVKDGALVMRSKGNKNLKIPPKTVLYSFNTGMIDEKHKNQGHVFKFAKPKEKVLDGATMVETTLGDFIKTSGADKLFAHSSFTKGVPPASFAMKKENRYHPKEGCETEQAIIDAVGKAPKTGLVWVVGCVAGKVQPKSLALINTCQIVLKGTEALAL